MLRLLVSAAVIVVIGIAGPGIALAAAAPSSTVTANATAMKTSVVTRPLARTLKGIPPQFGTGSGMVRLSLGNISMYGSENLPSQM